LPFRISPLGRDVLEDPTEIAEPHRRVKPLGHRRGLDAGRLTPSRKRIVQVCESQRGPSPRRRAGSNVPTL
jgi:hypothetical protein